MNSKLILAAAAVLAIAVMTCGASVPERNSQPVQRPRPPQPPPGYKQPRPPSVFGDANKPKPAQDGLVVPHGATVETSSTRETPHKLPVAFTEEADNDQVNDSNDSADLEADGFFWGGYLGGWGGWGGYGWGGRGWGGWGGWGYPYRYGWGGGWGSGWGGWGTGWGR